MSRRAVRVALAAAVLASVGYLLTVPLARPAQIGVATDVYYHAAAAWLAGADPYFAAPPAHPEFRFVYPPVVLPAFLPHFLSGSPAGALAVQTLSNLAAAAALLWVVRRGLDAAGAALARLDDLLVGAFVLVSVHSVSVFVMGQVTLWLALAVAAGTHLVAVADRDAAGGVAFALAAIVKLFPAAAGAWLLALRSRRGVVAAVGTGVGALLGGLALGPEHTVTFLTETLADERQTAAFAGGLPPESGFVTLRRPLSAALPGLDSGLFGPLAALLVAPPVLVSLWRVDDRRRRPAGLLATLVATLLVLPLEPLYYSLLYYPLVILLYTTTGRPRRLLAAGTVLISALVSYRGVVGVLASSGLPPGLAATVREAVATVFSVAQPPLVGSLLLLGGCVAIARERGTVSDGRETTDDEQE